MDSQKPTLSVIIATYNRGDLIATALDSVLAQSFKDLEIIVVNNGCTDHTAEVLKRYERHEKIRLFTLPVNKGWQRGYNFAFDQIRGEWFSLIGDDDRLEPKAYEIMLRVPDEVDPTIDAVTANTFDVRTGQMGGFGLDRDQYLPLEKIVKQTSGEFFGITKTSLLGDKRYNENLPGDSDTFYYKIDAIANRYYIHQALRQWGTLNVENESTRYRYHDLSYRIKLYRELLNEPFYWEVLKKHNSRQYLARCLRGLFFQKIDANWEASKRYFEMGKQTPSRSPKRLLFYLLNISPASLLQKMYQWSGHNAIGSFISTLLVRRYTTIKGK